MSACPHCPDGHRHPDTRSWGVYVGAERDGDDQPTHVRVQPSNGAHVAESDAEWLRQLITEAQVVPTKADRLGMVDAVLHTWREAGPMHPQAAELWRMIRAAVDGTLS